MSHLKLVRDKKQTAKTIESLYTGIAQSLDLSSNTPDKMEGLIDDYRVSKESATISPAKNSARLFFWDTGTSLKEFSEHNLLKGKPLEQYSLQGNHVTLQESQLFGPDIVHHDKQYTLSMTAQFDLQFNTQAYAAELACIDTVESHRFISLKDGQKTVLSDSGQDAVLHLASNDSPVMHTITDSQSHNTVNDYCHSTTISQVIPEEIEGDAVEELTVMEQYQTFFMQRGTGNESDFIWTPAHVPLTWGWSIRIAKRFDGEWAIVRRKLIRPTASNEGLQYPIWSHNSQQFQLQTLKEK